MGISNSIGSNVFDVLLCLGLPWFLKAALLPKVPGNHYVTINSQGLVYSSISLFSTLTVLYLSLLIGKFKLTRSVGIVCLVMYIIFLVFASILELNMFFIVNLPICLQWWALSTWNIAHGRQIPPNVTKHRIGQVLRYLFGIRVHFDRSTIGVASIRRQTCHVPK